MNQYAKLRVSFLVILFTCAVIASIGVYGYVSVMRTTRDLQQKMASYRSAQSVAEMTLADAAVLFASRQSSGVTLCKLIEQGLKRSRDDITFITIQANYCGKALTGDVGNDKSFTEPYLKAVGFRISGQFAKASLAYEQALAVLKQAQGVPQPEWEARASEGRAYALYRLNNLAEAEVEAENSLHYAQQAPNGMVLAAITYAKIVCAKNGDIAVAAQKIQRSKVLLEAILANPKSKLIERQYADLDLRALNNDGELSLVCGTM